VSARVSAGEKKELQLEGSLKAFAGGKAEPQR